MKILITGGAGFIGSNVADRYIADGHDVVIVDNLSSGGAGYGEQMEFPAKEGHLLQPLSPYGVSKVSVELYLHFYGKTHGLDYTILRYANIYGPRQDPLGEAGVVAIFTNAMFDGKQPIINGDGAQTRDYTYVGDVVEANLFSLSKGSGEAFNIGTGIETDVNELAQKLRGLIGYKGEITHGPAKSGEQKRSVIDPSKAGNMLGWKPKVSINEGLKRTVAWHKERL